MHCLTGDYPAAAQRSSARHCTSTVTSAIGSGQGEALMYLGIVHRLTGDYQTAAATFPAGPGAATETFGDRYKQASTRNELGTVPQRLTGD